MKTAIVHDWLTGLGGGEKVLEAICELYEGPIYTLLKDAQMIGQSPFASREITSSFLQRFPLVLKYYRNLLPLFPRAINSFDLSEYDLLLSSSHAVAKGVPTHQGQLHICYCHTPMRYAWDLLQFHLDSLPPPKRLLARPILHYMRHFDRSTQHRVDLFIANSECVADRIRRHYEREATVIHPPVDTHLFEIAPSKENYYITCSRLVPYKRVDLLVNAFAHLPNKRLVVIGDGPEMKRLRAVATKNVELIGHQPAPLLREMIAKAQGFLFAGEEDFGIVLAEAQAAGVPVIAYGRGGSREIVLPGQTGIFFDEQTPSSLIEAMHRFEKIKDDFEPEHIKKSAERFSKERFQDHFSAFVHKSLERKRELL